MSGSFRAFVLIMVVIWAVAPQLACFVPEQTPAQSEMGCCKGMAGDCNPTMSQECCQTLARVEVGIVAKVIRHFEPLAQIANVATDVVPVSLLVSHRQISNLSDDAPPGKPNGSSLILRI